MRRIERFCCPFSANLLNIEISKNLDGGQDGGHVTVAEATARN